MANFSFWAILYACEETIKHLELKDNTILNISALLLFKNSNAFTQCFIKTVPNIKKNKNF